MNYLLSKLPSCFAVSYELNGLGVMIKEYKVYIVKTFSIFQERTLLCYLSDKHTELQFPVTQKHSPYKITGSEVRLSTRSFLMKIGIRCAMKMVSRVSSEQCHDKTYLCHMQTRKAEIILR